MTYTSETLNQPLSTQTSAPNYASQTAIPKAPESQLEQPQKQLIVAKLTQLLAHLPPNDLALFGGESVRSQSYPAWPISDSRDIAAVTEVVQSQQWGGAPYPGPKTAEFAEKFAQMQSVGTLNGKHAVLLMNGSLTMEVALKAAGIGWGDEVIVPAYTFQATAAAPIAAGALPVIVDIDPHTYCISPAAIEAAITPQTKAIIPVHLGSQMADMDAVMAIAKRHNLIVIEDCAHAHGARWQGQGAGTIGDFGSFSLQSSKLLTTGEGGVLLCADPEMAARATSLIDCGRLPKDQRAAPTEGLVNQLLAVISQFGDDAETFGMGMNYRMTELQAALGTVALERFEAQQQVRAEAAAYLESRLIEVTGIRLLTQDERHTKRSIYRYIFALEPDSFGATHEEVCLALHAEGIACSKGYPAMHRYGLFQPQLSKLPVPSVRGDRFNFEDMSLPEAERACEREAIWLDESVFRAGQQGVDDVIEALKKVQRNAPILSAAKAAFLAQSASSQQTAPSGAE